MKIPFIKMNGAGNDFVVIDARAEKKYGELSREQIRAIASRDNAITKGCDQLIIMEPSTQADVFMRIYNADGGEVDACGNATRCVGWFLMEEHRKKNIPCNEVGVQTNADILKCRWTNKEFFKGKNDAVIEVNMGHPRFDPKEIQVGGEFDEALLRRIAEEIGIASVESATCVGMGNPHVIFFVSALPSLSLLESAGQCIKTIPLFTRKGVNLTIATVGKEAVFSLVYERGAGMTKSCGTAACAAAVAAVILGYRSKNMDIWVLQQQNGTQDLSVRWEENSGEVYLMGPVATEFKDVMDVQ